MNEEELEAAASKITEGNVRRLPGTTRCFFCGTSTALGILWTLLEFCLPGTLMLVHGFQAKHSGSVGLVHLLTHSCFFCHEGHVADTGQSS